ncbi:hypothetical protein [Pseudoxanthomonas sp. UTMC 1351]|uniref:hypothetical protein n=1 Tax=Pseudoxanthomonas sp. UTMC 1351 TaxID=2695853 RepID=UPI0034CD1809
MRIFLALAAALLMHTADARAERDYVPIEKRLSAEQLKATGLDQLSSTQLELLNSLLSEEQKTVVQAIKAESKGRPSGSLLGGGTEPISTALKGEFKGWSKGTVFNLENGQRWRVIDGDYYVGKAVASPRVQVTPGKISGWYLKVEGHNPSAKVQPLD